MLSHVPGRISVVVPVYNGARHLPDAVRSIQMQGHPDTEIILVDDGSSDDSWSVISGIAGAVAIRQQNQGPGAARNRGVEAASGEYLCFLDQDDLWCEGKTSLQLEWLKSDPGLGYVLGHTRFTLLDGHARPGWAKERYFEKPHPGYVVGVMMARRTAFDQVGPFSTGFASGVDDVEWFVRSQQLQVRREMLAETLLERRVHDSNFSGNTAQSNPELLSIIRRKLIAERQGKAG